ncbi:MAG: DUF3047 domain-containing protein [Magnetococcales bacterium]|nr:DUF3047 domain-containing protein [Magnetococcales bacterium]
MKQKWNKTRQRARHTGLALLLSWNSAVAQQAISFTPEEMARWEEQTFRGATRYTPLLHQGRAALRAEAHGSASGRILRQRIDLRQTPFLHWSWFLPASPLDSNPREKQGDDFALRVYVLFSGGWAFWQSRAINYVWSAREAAGSNWPNPFTDRARMVSVRQGPEAVGRWVEEARDIRQDHRNLFGYDVDYVDALAIMSDTDNTGSSATGYYGEIVFSTQR